MKIFKLIEKGITQASAKEPLNNLYAQIKVSGHLVINSSDGQVLGVVSANEFHFENAAELVAFVSAKTVVSPDQDISEAYRLMRTGGLDCLPVYDNGIFAGIVTLDKITERVFMIISERQQLYQKVVHDLRNPVSNFMGLNRLLLEIDQSEETKELLSLMDHSAKHVMEILNDLLFVEIDENKPLQKEPTELNGFYAGCVTDQLGLSALKQIRIHTNFCPGEFLKHIDRLQMKRAVHNVISNAVKFSYPGASITISTSVTGNTLTLSIRDTGIGIPENFKSEVFQRFSPVGRVGTSGEPTTGLGLCFSKQCVEQHNGHIGFESIEDEGTTFFITL